VRSSGANEDGADASYAGVYESILNVRAESLVDALGEVARSLAGTRARAYAGNGSGPERLGIVVQAMVPAEYAGVLFTEHPGESGAMLVEWVAGLGEELVSGRAQPSSLRFGRCSAKPLDACNPPVDMAGLIELGRRVEGLFGRPQDVEWAFAGGRFYLLQARDITHRMAVGTRARGRARAPAGRGARRAAGRGRALAE
jgi:phosphoenolpyruvate synthase/pyruvate phosphate dikinase